MDLLTFRQLWLRIDHSRHPHNVSLSISEIEQDIFKNAIANGVLCAPGAWFRAEPDSPAPKAFLRVTYASASEAQMRVAVQRLGIAIRKSFTADSQDMNSKNEFI